VPGFTFEAFKIVSSNVPDKLHSFFFAKFGFCVNELLLILTQHCFNLLSNDNLKGPYPVEL
jgi:hypothetical protein